MKTIFKNIKNTLATLVAVTFLAVFGLANQSHACVGNLCATEYVEAGGSGQTEGWYNAQGTANNQASGNIVERVAVAESAGSSQQATEFTADTCDSTDCGGLRAQVNGETTAFQKSYSFISSDGGGASSSAHGDATSGNSAVSDAYRVPKQH